jgi:serine/threonine protein kinase
VHKPTGFTVAIKTYDKKNLTNAQANRAVHSEIDTLADLNHPNIMRLFEVIDERKQVHLVMELCKGVPLQHLVKKQPQQRLEESVCRTIFV